MVQISRCYVWKDPIVGLIDPQQWIDSAVVVLQSFIKSQETLFRRVWFGGGRRGAPRKGQHSPAEIEKLTLGQTDCYCIRE